MLHGTEGKNDKNGDGCKVVGSAPATRVALLKTGYALGDRRVVLSDQHDEDDALRVTRMDMELGQTNEVVPLKVSRETPSLTYSR